MFEGAERTSGGWTLWNGWGDKLFLPVTSQDLPVEVGLLGTGALGTFESKRLSFAQLLLSLNRPIYLIDTRRNGCGAQGCWSPRELATEVPSMMPAVENYAFVHLPVVAPSIDLLARSRKETINWKDFRDYYIAELKPEAIRVAAAFVESAATRGGLGVLMCSERDAKDFDTRPEQEKDDLYCHRFTLSSRIKEELCGTTERPFREIRLRLEDFVKPSRTRKNSL